MGKKVRESYLAKLRDPRWQKRRLLILNRDQWECQRCGDSESTLHVHHLWYDGEPWDVPDDALVTLCEPCHEDEASTRRQSESELIASVRGRLPLAWQLDELAHGFSAASRDVLNRNYCSGMSTIAWVLSEPEGMAAAVSLRSHWFATKGSLPRIPDPIEDEKDLDFTESSLWWDAYALTTPEADAGPWAFLSFVSAHYPNGEWICGESSNDQA